MTQENEINQGIVDPDQAEPKSFQGIRKWLAIRRVPHREADSLLDGMSEFQDRVADSLDGHFPYQMVATATGRQAGRVHVSLHLTWEGLQLGEQQHDSLMRSLGQEFTSGVGHLQERHVKAHIMFVPASSYEGQGFEGFVQSYANKESLTYCGTPTS